MPGTITFKPIEANLTHNTEFFGKMSPYCSFLVGTEKVQNQACPKGGKHPHWNDSVIVPVQNESTVVVEVLDKDKLTHDDKVGNCTIDLREVEARGRVSRWYPLTYKNKPVGEILLESVFESELSSTGQALQGGQVMNQPSGETIVPMASTIQTATVSGGQAFQGEQIGATQAPSWQQGDLLTGEKNFRNEEEILHHSHQESLHQSSSHKHGGHVFIEQRQVVEPHTFTKSVEVVETRPVSKDIEVLEPHKVLKEVQYTEAIPVKKQIEVIEPQVVMKEIEVMEPRLVTKQIQVVENVPVKKLIEVIESRTIIKEVESYEPQTFTKQVEVTEQVPVKKQVTVTEPFTVTKTVDFIEPIITTKTITKEVLEPIIVDEKITQSVGPATVVGAKQRTYIDRFNEMRLSEEQRIVEQQSRTEEQRRLEQERLWEQEKLRSENVANQVGGHSSYAHQSGQQIGTGEMEAGKYSSTSETGQLIGSEGFEGKHENIYGTRHKKY